MPAAVVFCARLRRLRPRPPFPDPFPPRTTHALLRQHLRDLVLVVVLLVGDRTKDVMDCRIASAAGVCTVHPQPPEGSHPPAGPGSSIGPGVHAVSVRVHGRAFFADSLGVRLALPACPSPLPLLRDTDRPCGHSCHAILGTAPAASSLGPVMPDPPWSVWAAAAAPAGASFHHWPRRFMHPRRPDGRPPPG